MTTQELMDLPDDVQQAVQPVLDVLPPEKALRQLVVEQGAPDELVELINTVLQQPPIATRPTLQAGLWLYVDELDRSHEISRGIDDNTGSFWHGIMHRREGDFPNSHHWFRKVGTHPAMAQIGFDYDPHRFIDEVATIEQGAGDRVRMVDLQRREWMILFQWCATQR